MTFVASAIAGAAVVGAGASIYGSSQAAKAQERAANTAITIDGKTMGQSRLNLNRKPDILPCAHVLAGFPLRSCCCNLNR
jgi:hypothetical protein